MENIRTRYNMLEREIANKKNELQKLEAQSFDLFCKLKHKHSCGFCPRAFYDYGKLDIHIHNDHKIRNYFNRFVRLINPFWYLDKVMGYRE